MEQRECIDLGPGTRCQPWVLGPSNMPAITALEEAEANVEIAFLSAIEHARGTDFTAAMQIILAALTAGKKKLDADRFGMYFDLFTLYLKESAPKAFRAIMNPSAYEFKSDFARSCFGRGKKAGAIEGRKEGRIEERVELILKILEARFGTLTGEARTRVRGARDALSDKFVKQMMRAKTIEQVLELLR